MTKVEFEKTDEEVRARHQSLVERPNEVREEFYNGVYKRCKYPALTGDHAPLEWRLDFNPETNPIFLNVLECMRRSTPVQLRLVAKSS